MSSNYYQLYIQKVLQLAETIVIKSDISAETLNKFVTDYFGPEAVDGLRPETWKYYLNLAGEYHPTDTPMSVVSMDTLETILFSRQNLLVHRATARGYAYGTRQYKALVAQYPEQEMLILGILYPVDIQKAIAARDGQILGYPPGLVEANEYSLMAKLQTWIDGFKLRWTNQQFSISDDLYAATALGIMYQNLVPAILTLRLQACKTNEAHSFHLRHYLASHGLLDSYIDSMTLKQQLFFYRNIAYIERNVGKRNIFAWLVEHIMTERGLPLAEFTMRHDVSRQPDELYPTPVFRRSPINLEYSQAKDTITLEQLLAKEDGQARDNAKYRADALPVIREQMENSTSNVVLTKMLESSVVDTSDSAPHTLEEVLLSEWLHLSVSGLYRAYVSITNPKSGERVPLTVKDAYTFVWYAFCRSVGIELVEVPQMLAAHAQRIPTPDVAELMSVVSSSLVPMATAEQALSLQPTIGGLISTEAFYDLCVKIYQAGMMQRKLVAWQEHHMRRAMVQNMVERIYSDNVLTPEPAGTSYASWFAARNIKIAQFTVSDLTLMYTALMQEATGLSLHPTSSLKAMQAAMIKLLGQLSSYSIQIVSDINLSNVKKTDWTAVRVGNMADRLVSHQRFPDAVVGVQNATGSIRTAQVLKVWDAYTVRASSRNVRGHDKLDIDAKIDHKVSYISRPGRLQAATVLASMKAPVLVDGDGTPAMPGVDRYLLLSELQKQKLRDIYNRDIAQSLPDAQTALADLVTNTTLDGLSFDPLVPTPAPTPAPTPTPSPTPAPATYYYLDLVAAGSTATELVAADTVATAASALSTYYNTAVVLDHATGTQAYFTSKYGTWIFQIRQTSVPQAAVVNAPPGQRIASWTHPTNQFGVPYVSADFAVNRMICHPGPQHQRPTIQWTNLGPSGDFTFTAHVVNDSQSDSNYYEVAAGGAVIATIFQGQTVTNQSVTVANGETLEFQLTGASFSGGADFITISITDGVQIWDVMQDFITNLGAQVGAWRYFYRASGGVSGALNDGGSALVPNYTSLTP